MFLMFLSDEGPTLETLDFILYPRIGRTPTFLYFDLYLNTAYAAHYVYFIFELTHLWQKTKTDFLMFLLCIPDLGSRNFYLRGDEI